jgi:hypothetical protein
MASGSRTIGSAAAGTLQRRLDLADVDQSLCNVFVAAAERFFTQTKGSLKQRQRIFRPFLTGEDSGSRRRRFSLRANTVEGGAGSDSHTAGEISAAP